ncbi:MAG TPA: quinone-dependent dihydroorotate dehydrogenase [Solirubrobacteraceae bacterium]
MGVYPVLVRPLLFRADPERAHDLAVRAAERASGSRLVCRAVASRRAATDPRLAVAVAGLRFATPLGLAAGFDKSARAVPLLSALGFGHVEVGSISAAPSDGNPRPRLFRLVDERAIVVHYGVPNDGAARVAERLAAPRPAVPLGINVVSTNRGAASAVEPDDAVIGDYVESVSRLQELGEYVCLNLSCPNTRDGVGFFADRRRLRTLLDRLGEAGVRRPLFIKVAPFADEADLDSFLEAVDPAPFVSGFSVNLPPGKPPGIVNDMPGAVSGPPCAPAALRTVAALYRRMDRSRFVVVGSGGVFSGADAYAMIRQGASLVQLYTALVYEGPGVVRRVTTELGQLVVRDGLSSIGDAVGADV